MAFVLYAVSLFGGLVQDDIKVISEDPDMGNAGSLIKTWTRPYYYTVGNDFSVYRPLTTFSFYLNALIIGKEAWGFRLGNILIYAWVCGLVYQVLQKWTSENRAFWGTILFTVLPIHTEAVNNIVGRAELLALGLVLWAIGKSMEKKWELTALLLFLAMLSKETAMAGVPLVWYLIWSNSEIKKEEKGGAGFFVGMALIGLILLRLVVLGGWGIGNAATMVENPLKFMSVEKRVMNALAILPFGVGKIIYPKNLSYDYSYNQIKMVKEWWNWKVILGLGMMGGSILSLLKNDWRKNKLWVMGLILFWGPILMTGNLLFPIGTIFGERLWFWPSLGVVMCLLGCFEVRQIPYSRVTVSSADGGFPSALMYMVLAVLARTSATALVIILILFMGRTMIRNFDWLSQERLFIHDATYASDSVMAKNNAAAMYLLKQDLPAAKVLMEEANEIYPQYPELLNNWGMYDLMTGKTVEAKKKFEECLLARPGNQLCQRNLELMNKKER